MTQTRSSKKYKRSNVESETSSKSPRKLFQSSESPDIKVSSNVSGSPSQDFYKSNPVTSPLHAKAGPSKKVSKSILKEKICDLELQNRIYVVSMFQTLGCESLFSPPRDVYPNLVSEFYKNLVVTEDDLVTSMVKGRHIVFRSYGFA